MADFEPTAGLPVTPACIVRLGVVADTHGTLPERALEVFREAGVERIVHAGDVGTQAVISSLELVAPVVAVRGNMDVEQWAAALPPRAHLTVAGLRVRVAHQQTDALRGMPPAEAGVDVVIYGHTHVPHSEWDADGVFWVNPGSPSQSRRGSGHKVAILEIATGARPRVRFEDV